MSTFCYLSKIPSTILSIIFGVLFLFFLKSLPMCLLFAIASYHLITCGTLYEKKNGYFRVHVSYILNVLRLLALYMSFLHSLCGWTSFPSLHIASFLFIFLRPVKNTAANKNTSTTSLYLSYIEMVIVVDVYIYL